MGGVPGERDGAVDTVLYRGENEREPAKKLQAACREVLAVLTL